MDMILFFCQAIGQTWYHTSAYHLSTLGTLLASCEQQSQHDFQKVSQLDGKFYATIGFGTTRGQTFIFHSIF